MTFRIRSRRNLTNLVIARLGNIGFQRCLLILVVAVAGCSRSSIERTTISGTVTLDGKPLPEGQIRFVPTGETQGPSWSARIKQGHYTTAGTKGVPVGDLRVEIKGYRVPDNYKGAGTDDSEGIPQEQYLPAKYNTQSELKLSVPSGSGNIEKSWELTSK